MTGPYERISDRLHDDEGGPPHQRQSFATLHEAKHAPAPEGYYPVRIVGPEGELAWSEADQWTLI